jgi:hypothetical protein
MEEQKMSPALLLVERASRQVGVREDKPYNNTGKSVEVYQKAVDGKAQKEPWCMGLVQFCIKKIEAETGKKSRIYRSEHCLTVWNKSPKPMRILKPEPGCVVIWRHGASTSGHTGIVESVGVDFMVVIEGNTNDDGSREGNGVYRKKRKIKVGDGSLKIMGFLRVFED